MRGPTDTGAPTGAPTSGSALTFDTILIHYAIGHLNIEHMDCLALDTGLSKSTFDDRLPSAA